MKRLIAGLAGILFLSTLSPSFAEDIQTPHVSVTGTTTREVVPNQMLWTLTVLSRGAKIEDVATDHSKLQADVLAFLKEAGINPKEVQTSRMEFGEDWAYENQTRVLKGYLASATVTFKLTDFALYQKLWLGLAKQKGVSIQNVAYDNTSRITYQNEVRKNAALAAREKARLLAVSLGCTIAEPLSIVEEPQYPAMRFNAFANNLSSADADGKSASGDPIAPGTIPITITVQATFRLVNTVK